MKWNMVTERGPVSGKTLWLVSTEWRGGDDKRRFMLHNVYDDERQAKAEWEAQTAENHNNNYKLPSGFDAGFIRHPLRKFTEVVE